MINEKYGDKVIGISNGGRRVVLENRPSLLVKRLEKVYNFHGFVWT